MIRLAIALLIAIALFDLYSEPVYANCHNTADGYACDLVGYKWGR
jgi:hypothetical protein